MVLKSVYDGVPANPHFAFHAETLVNGTYYDPSYGTTGLITFQEAAPAGYPYYDPYPTNYYDNHTPAATRQTGSSFPPGTVHKVNYTCPH